MREQNPVFAVFWVMAGVVEAECLVSGILALGNLVDVKGMAITVSKEFIFLINCCLLRMTFLDEEIYMLA